VGIDRASPTRTRLDGSRHLFPSGCMLAHGSQPREAATLCVLARLRVLSLVPRRL
jgi:hypothetical protein